MSDYSARRVPGLDLVRSVAILCVVVGHYWPLYDRFPGLAPLRFLAILGVEIFFVLSGFLIGGILLRQAAELAGRSQPFKVANAPDFWVRRWFRTLPNYLLFYGVFLVSDQPWTKDHWGAWVLSIFFLQNLWSDWTDGTFGVAWSLCVEEWLYLLLPLVLAGWTRVAGTPARAAGAAAATLVIVPTLLRFATIGRPWDLGVRHIVLFRLDAIAFGVGLAYAARDRRKIFECLSEARWALFGTLALLGGWLFYLAWGESWIDDGGARTGIRWLVMSVLFFPFLSLAIVPVVAWASRLASLPWGCRSFVYRTSLYSYSMYLAHVLVIYFASPWLYAALRRVFGEFHGMTFAMAGAVLVVLYAVSAVVYHAWEAPMTRLRERYSSFRPATAAALVTTHG